MLVAGGDNGSSVFSSAEVFNPATNSFSSAGIGSMSIARTGAVAAPLPDGRVLVAGGRNGPSYLSSAEVFNPSTNSFSSAGIGSMVTPRGVAVAAPLPDGRVLVAGRLQRLRCLKRRGLQPCRQQLQLAGDRIDGHRA